jgi:hypothetical protein
MTKAKDTEEEMAVSEAVKNETYQAIGEFVIVFQWVENLYRQIGWFILDPERKQWPPMQLRVETNYKLINTVTDLFVDLTKLHAFPNGAEKAGEMQVLKTRFHDLRDAAEIGGASRRSSLSACFNPPPRRDAAVIHFATQREPSCQRFQSAAAS